MSSTVTAIREHYAGALHYTTELAALLRRQKDPMLNDVAQHLGALPSIITPESKDFEGEVSILLHISEHYDEAVEEMMGNPRWSELSDTLRKRILDKLDVIGSWLSQRGPAAILWSQRARGGRARLRAELLAAIEAAPAGERGAIVARYVNPDSGPWGALLGDLVGVGDIVCNLATGDIHRITGEYVGMQVFVMPGEPVDMAEVGSLTVYGYSFPRARMVPVNSSLLVAKAADTALFDFTKEFDVAHGISKLKERVAEWVACRRFAPVELSEFDPSPGDDFETLLSKLHFAVKKVRKAERGANRNLLDYWVDAVMPAPHIVRRERAVGRMTDGVRSQFFDTDTV